MLTRQDGFLTRDRTMPDRIVEVATDGVHLSVERGFLTLSHKGGRLGQVPLDDIGALVVHGHGATFSANLCSRLADRAVPMVICGSNHAPVAVVAPVANHHQQGHRIEAQASASQPTRKRLWATLVKAKINSQAAVLVASGRPLPGLSAMARRVKSGDPDNLEAQAARRYWPALMGKGFVRRDDANAANGMLNYGYTVLRAATARSICAAGLHPSLSLHHRSRGDALRLADDLMEPFRPWVDWTVWQHRQHHDGLLDTDSKRAIAACLTLDLVSNHGTSPIQTCLDRLAISLAQVFNGNRRNLDLPEPKLAQPDPTTIGRPWPISAAIESCG